MTQPPSRASARRAAFVRGNLHDCTPAIPRALKASAGRFDQVEVLCWNRSGEPLPGLEVADGVQVRRFGVPARPRSLQALAATLGYQLWLFYRLARAAPAFVQVCDFESAVPAAAYRLLSGARLIYDMRDPFALSYGFPAPLRSLAYALDWLVMACSHGFVVPADTRVEYLGRWGRRRPLVVVPNTCEEQPTATLAGWPDGPGIAIAYLGYVVLTRGALQLLELCRDLGDRVRLVTAGHVRSPDFLRLAQDLPNVHLLGRRSPQEALEIMRRARAVALLYDPAVPVNRISAPNKFFEAMMVGTPVLVSSGSGPAETVARDGLGVVVPYGDRDALRRAVIRLADDREHAAMSRRCRAWFETHGSLEEALERYRRFYDRILGRQTTAQRP